MTNQSEEQLISLQFMFALANLIQIEHEMYFEDVNHLSPQVRVLAKRIKSDAKTVINHLKQKAKLKDEEHVIDYCLPFHEVVKLFACCSQENIEEFLDQVKEKV